jgi:pectin methylesterase-like acyl-CoA thioesterase
MKKFIIILLIAFSTIIYADIIFVPQDYSTIQEEIDNASAGDTIIVSSGIYPEYLTINKSLTIQGSAEDSTWIQKIDWHQSQVSNTSDVTMENLYFKNFYFGPMQNPDAFFFG